MDDYAGNDPASASIYLLSTPRIIATTWYDAAVFPFRRIADLKMEDCAGVEPASLFYQLPLTAGRLNRSANSP